jgi:predicted nuclease of predicted toxin-antitoxin system
VNFLLDHDVPDDLSHLLEYLGHTVRRVRDALSPEASDVEVLDHALQNELIVVTCNRDDFLELGQARRHHGIVILIRRRSRAAERGEMLRLIEGAGAQGLTGNINFA